MPMSRSLGAYYDVQQIFVAARENGGAVYTLESEKAAIRWRARAYHYRSLLAQSDERAHPNQPGYLPITPWDDIYLQCDGPKVIITFGALKGKLTSLEGKKLEAKAPAPVPFGPDTDALLQLALNLADTKGDQS